VSRLLCVAITLIALTACGGSQSTEPATGPATGPEPGADASPGEPASDAAPAGENEFQLQTSEDAGQARGDHPSEIEATVTHAAMRLFVVNPDTGPIQGIVIRLTGPDGTTYYTGETDSVGYAEVLVPAGQRYDVEYLSLGRRNTSAAVEVPPGPHQDIRLTMRYRRIRPPAPPPAAAPEPQGIVLDGILFGTGSATIQTESSPRLDRVVEYMAHRLSARIRIGGHTDNVGDPQRNQALSESRAQAVRDYLVSHGIDAGRIEAIGYGDQRPVASNDTEEGRRQNRRIEATEF
jgi:outer membrane protein OmpA-like peptidoglycan-associated protein